MFIPFGELQADLEPLNNPGALRAHNCLPAARSYVPLRAPVAFADALPGRPLGGVSFFDTKSGSTVTIIGTATNLYRRVGAAWTSIASGFAASARHGWSFQKMGRKLIGGCGNGGLMSIDLDTGAVAGIAGSPNATCLAVIGPYLFAGVGEELHNSGANDGTDWAYGGASGADIQPIITGGSINGLTGGEIGYAFMENAIRRIAPGGDINYSFNEIETDQGLVVAGSLVKFRSVAFYLARNGFYRFDGGGSVPIGEDRIDKSFYRDVDEGAIDQMRAAIDPINKLVLWSYQSRNAPVRGVNDKLLIYNYVKERFTTASVPSTLLMSTVTESATTDAYGLPDIDASTEMVDSRIFLGGSPLLTLFGADNRPASMTGATLAASVQTGEIELGKKGAVHLQDVRSVVDGAVGTMTAEVREYLSEPAQAVGSTRHPARPAVHNFDKVRCRFARLRVEIEAGAEWQFAMGVEIDAVAPGGNA